MKLTKDHARKVLEVVDHGLTSGVGNPVPGEMCVMAAINYALGEEHGDKPSCVHHVIRSFDIALNDAKWSSDKARARGMRREAIAKLGSTEIDGRAWAAYVAEQHIRRVLPIPLRIVADLIPDHREALLAAAQRCEDEGTAVAAWSAESAAWSAESAESAESAAWSAWSAAESAAWSAESAAESAAWSAESAAESAAWSAESAKLAGHNPDEILELSAQIAEEACIKFKTQGSEWMDILTGETT